VVRKDLPNPAKGQEDTNPTQRQENIMAQIPSLQEMLEAGVHFGHQTRRWNPRMKPYILTSRNGIYVINLEKTLEALQRAVEKILRVRSTGASVLFVGTKATIQGAVRDEATRSGQPYVTTRWLGGMLTNYQTIRKSIKHLEDIERMENDGVLTDLTKKEASDLMEEKTRLQDVFGGIRNLRNLPGLVFIADAKTEQIAIAEAKRLGIPTVAIVDTNTDPTLVDYPIPANDDAIKSVRLIASTIANAVMSGGQPQAAPVLAAPAAVAVAPAVAEVVA
jgi:small subunit ribosomal protein S2